MEPQDVVKPAIEGVTTAGLLGLILWALWKVASKTIDAMIAYAGAGSKAHMDLVNGQLSALRADAAAREAAYRSDVMRELDRNVSRMNAQDDRIAEILYEVKVTHEEVRELRRDVRNDGSITGDIVRPVSEPRQLPSGVTVETVARPPKGGPKR